MGAANLKAFRQEISLKELKRLTTVQLRHVATKLGVSGRSSEMLPQKLAVEFGSRWSSLRDALDAQQAGDARAFDEWLQKLRK